MSIDLSKAKAISDQYGAWKQLADASGRVLWSAVKNVTVTVTSNSLYSSNTYSTDVSYKTPDGSTGTLNTVGTYELPAGTILTMIVEEYEKTGHVYVNNTSVGNTDGNNGYLKYSYTLTTNISLTHKYYGGANIYITEIRNDPATVTLRVSSSSDGNAKGSDVYFRINADVAPMPNVPQYVVNPYTMDGGSDETLTISVPAGTIINCKARGSGSVKLNGVNVGVTTYDYTVTGDATLYMSVEYDYNNGTYANITINET